MGLYIGTGLGPVRVGASTRRRRKTPVRGGVLALAIVVSLITWPLVALGVSFGVAFCVGLGIVFLGYILVRVGSHQPKKPVKPARKVSSR